MPNLPLYQHKLKVLFIDDNKPYLETIGDELRKRFIVETFDNPIKALDYIKNTPASISFKFAELTPDFEGERVLIDLKINQIANLADIEKTEIGVVIVDHNMPEMSGIDLCKQLPANICKILLTGDDDSSEAIKYFNSNVIDYYYIKGVETLITELYEVVEEAIKYNFIEKSKHIYNALNSNNFPLYSNKLCSYINNIFKINNSSEFYLLDTNGSYLFFNNKQRNYIIVHNDVSISQFIENYKDIELIAPIIEKIKNKDVIPVFYNQLPEDIPFDKWEDYIATYDTVNDINNNYYVAVIYG